MQKDSSSKSRKRRRDSSDFPKISKFKCNDLTVITHAYAHTVKIFVFILLYLSHIHTVKIFVIIV